MPSPRYPSQVQTLYGVFDQADAASRYGRLTVGADGTGYLQVEVPATSLGGPTEGWAAVARLAKWPGGVEIYGNWDGLVDTTPTNVPNPPYQIDWQVFAGVGCANGGASLDDELQPTFQGSTVVKIADQSRYGLMCQIGGTAANFYLIRARIPDFPGAGNGAGGTANVTLSFRFLPGLLGPTRVVQSGSFIG